MTLRGTFISVLISVATLVSAPVARAEIITITWEKAGRFGRVFAVMPGKFLEVCGKLSKGESVAWSFRAGAPVDFNVHYHEGKQVVYPDKRDASVSAHGNLAVAVNQDYCWMWSNKGQASVTVSLDMSRRRVSTSSRKSSWKSGPPLARLVC